MAHGLRTVLFSVATASITVIPSWAQSGTVSGKVTESAGGSPLAGAVVSLEANGIGAAAGTTGPSGRYRITRVAPGTYTVVVRAVGYGRRDFPNTMVSASSAVTVDAVLTLAPRRLEEISVTGVSKVEENQIKAPAAVFVQLRQELEERPALTVVDHLKTIPGADVIQGGLVHSNFVARGFNNIFSGSLLTLIDYRYAAVPVNNVNLAALFPPAGDDIERIEFVLGPGAALYGPNAANGVMNVITRSPFTSTGTTLTLEGGGRAGSTERHCGAGPHCDPAITSLDGTHGLWRVTARHAMKLGPKVAFKVSGSYLKGIEWKSRDSLEPANLDVLNPGLGLPRGRCNPTTGCRDFNLEQYGGEARVDFHPDLDTEIIGTYGFANITSGIEYISIGAAQTRDWRYSAAQLRFRHKRLFAQAFGNFSNSGRTFGLRTDVGNIKDRSRVWSAQFQHGMDLFSGKTTLLYGADYIDTDPRTNGTINGMNEAADHIKEVGGYIHSVTRLGSRLDFVAAIRLDKHNRLESAVWSPRAALVFKPTENQAVRLTFNHAFSTPTNSDLFLDLAVGLIPLGPGLRYDIRALGVPKDGFRFRSNGGCVGGAGNGLCMRTPFQPLLPPGTPELLPAKAELLWQVAVGAVCPAAGQQVCQLMQGNAPTNRVGTQLRMLDPASHQFFDIANPADQVADIARLKPTINQQLEIGYKALLGGRFQISVDTWYEKKRNHIGPLLVESPTVFLDSATTVAYLTDLFTQHSIPNAAAVAAGLGTGMAGRSAATNRETTGVPLATVVPTNTALTTRPDIILTSRNFGELDLWGADLALDLVMGTHWTLAGSYSFVNKDFFSKSDVDRPTDVALNASRSKGSLTVGWRDDRHGWSTETRFRAVKGFPALSGVYSSPRDPDDPSRFLPTDSYGVLDLQGAWKPPIGARNMLLSVNVQNLLNRHYATFVGLPNLGRFVLTKVSYTF